MARVNVLMIRDRGANFRGEKVLFEEDKARDLVAQKVCVLLDDDGNPVLPTVGVVDEVGGDSMGGATGGDGKPDGKSAAAGKKPAKSKAKSDSQPNPFEIDGFDSKVVGALADAGITNPEELRAYVASGKSLAELPVIGVVAEKELLDLYVPNQFEISNLRF
jgi:hypothetical protein